MDGEKDSRGEDWVDEACGIAGENPAVTGEARVAVGIIASGMDGGDSGILADPLAHEIGIVDRPTNGDQLGLSGLMFHRFRPRVGHANSERSRRIF